MNRSTPLTKKTSNSDSAPAAVPRQCPLCGHRFEFDPARNTGGCSSCPLGKGCGLVLCPNCRYEFPEESQVVNWFRRRWRGGRKAAEALPWDDAPDDIPLSDLGAGKVGEIVSLETGRHGRANRLSAMGLTPGSRVTVRQRLPVLVILIGETEIALDSAVTRRIRVRPVVNQRKNERSEAR